MEIEIPIWLTTDFISTALKSNETSDNITVLDLQVDKPIAEGNNYVADIFRAQFKHYNTDPASIQSKSLIIKAPSNNGTSEFAKKTGIIEKEMRLYKEYLPKVNDLLRKHKEDNITANSYISAIENVIIMEDLKFSGYEMADRLKQLDYDHCCVALKALAKFHAASVILHEDDPEFVEGIGIEAYYTENQGSEDMERFTNTGFSILADEVRPLPSLGKYSDGLRAYSKTAWNTSKKILKPGKGKFNALNHGDFWVTNMLFKYDQNGKPTSVRLIDLQETRYSSPVLDLIYFFNTSARDDIRKHKSAELIDIYHQELNDKLELFGTNQRLSRQEIDEELKKRGFFEVIVNVAILPWILADPDKCKIIGVGDITSEDDPEENPLKMYYIIEPYKGIIFKRLVEFEEKGWL